MCGITGILHFNNDRTVNKEVLKKMTDSLHHRGPDAEGFFLKNNIGLGHRRLSIIDLSTGDQPMCNEDKSIVLIHNGEIYNYIELREELKGLGYKFKTESDTEVVLKSYEKWGDDCQKKFNGMWAFALWDENEKKLLLSRDRAGEKPLVYTLYDNTFLFGSEIKSILNYGIPKMVNEEVKEIYLTLGYVPAPFTFYKGFHKLRAGHYLVVKNGSVQEKKYWDLPEVDENNMLKDKDKIYKEFSRLMYDSVKIRMRSDVPYGAFLSGGLDSSSVVYLMSEISSKQVETYTIGFKEKVFDERHLAREVAARFNTNHHEHLVNPDSFDESLKKILYHYDEPFGDSSAIPTGIVSKYARQDVKMVLTGDGGDEVLSGYLIYLAEKITGLYQMIPDIIRKSMISALDISKPLTQGNIRYTLNRARNACYGASLPFRIRLMAKQRWADQNNIDNLLSNKNNAIKIADYFDDVFKSCTYKSDFLQLLYFHTKVGLPDDMLTKVDKMSMANSLETRLPFLDHRLIEFMIHVDKSIKLDGFERKSILRNTIGKKLPASLLNAPKKGFGVPLREWFKDNEFDSRLKELHEQDFGLDKNEIKKIVMDNKEGKRDYGNFIWMLFVLKKWMEN